MSSRATICTWPTLALFDFLAPSRRSSQLPRRDVLSARAVVSRDRVCRCVGSFVYLAASGAVVCRCRAGYVRVCGGMWAVALGLCVPCGPSPGPSASQ
eukprot:scaffold17183_cov124-Isochrysis_galbana.AAC.1